MHPSYQSACSLLYRYSADILILHGHGCSTCNGAKQIKTKCPCRCNHHDGKEVQHAHFMPIVGVGNRGVYSLVHGDLQKQHSFETTY